MSKAIFGYYVNLDERGEFYADVRRPDGTTVYEVRIPDEDGGSIIEDGYMSHKEDTTGLSTYLQCLGVIPLEGEVLCMADFEERLSHAEEPETDDTYEAEF